jgi:type II secretory pathway component PulK
MVLRPKLSRLAQVSRFSACLPLHSSHEVIRRLVRRHARMLAVVWLSAGAFTAQVGYAHLITCSTLSAHGLILPTGCTAE